VRPARGAPAGQDQSPPARLSWAGFVDWYAALPRTLALGLAVVVLLFFINLFSGIGTVWFHWPAMPILIMALFFALRASGRHRRSDRRRGGWRDRC